MSNLNSIRTAFKPVAGGRLHREITSLKHSMPTSSKAAAIVLAVAFFNSQQSFAAEESKSDKAFQLCLSKCIYASTKPPPIGSSTERLEVTVPRGQVIKECKVECATTKEQLMMGKPKMKSDTSPDK